MSTPMLMNDHPTEETLAAFMDHRLEETAHQEAIQHLADCGECRELVLMTADFQQSETTNVVRPTFGRGRVAGVAAAIAIAAGLAVVFLPPLFQRDMGDVIAASQALSQRPSDGRFGGHPYKVEPPTYRNASPPPSTDKELAEKADLYEIAVEAKDPHIRGVALLFVAEGDDQVDEIDEAIKLLEEAYADASGKKRDAVAIDLAAALLLRARWTPEVAARAYQLADDVYTRTRNLDAEWNRAVALQMIGKDTEAIAAYDEYRKHDPTSRWGNEAEVRAARLKE